MHGRFSDQSPCSVNHLFFGACRRCRRSAFHLSVHLWALRASAMAVQYMQTTLQVLMELSIYRCPRLIQAHIGNQSTGAAVYVKGVLAMCSDGALVRHNTAPITDLGQCTTRHKDYLMQFALHHKSFSMFAGDVLNSWSFMKLGRPA